MQDDIEKTLELPCGLTDDELRAKGAEHAAARMEWERVRLEAAEKAKEYREQLSEIDGRISTLAREIDRRAELRDVECIERRDLAKGTVAIIRSDTGELVSERTLSADERQVIMFGPRMVGAGA